MAILGMSAKAASFIRTAYRSLSSQQRWEYRLTIGGVTVDGTRQESTYATRIPLRRPWFGCHVATKS